MKKVFVNKKTKIIDAVVPEGKKISIGIIGTSVIGGKKIPFGTRTHDLKDYDDSKKPAVDLVLGKTKYMAPSKPKANK